MDKRGIIIINKPQGASSQKVVSACRRAFETRRVGHCGTLDPIAEGVLPVLIGTATRAAQFIIEKDKRYTATVRLGLTTDTLDTTGEVMAQKDVNVTRDELLSVLESFRGDLLQVPPMYSAIQKDGQRLYALARQGIEVEREARAISISEIKLLDFDGESFTVDVCCSKGTYIRSLAADIGEKLGCGGCISRLVRTRSGDFRIEDSITLDEMFELKEKGALDKRLMPIDSFFGSWARLDLNKKQATRVKNGVPIYYKDAPLGKRFRLYDENGEFIAFSEAVLIEDRTCLKLIRAFY